MSLTAAQQEELLALVPTAAYVPCDEAVANVRACKTDQEIGILREAFHIAERAIHDGFAETKVGMTHKAVLDTITGHAAALGASRSRSSLASGDTPPHSEVGGKKITPGEVVRIDFVGRYEGYYYDIGRTAVVGDPSPEVRDFYRGRWRVQRKLYDFMKPGVRACDVYWRAFDCFEEEGLPLAEVGPHIGHGIGIGIHESPINQPYERRELEPNMTFCIEPRFPVPGVGVFHIEDLIRITDTGSEVLSDLYDTSEIIAIEV
jgi:Xaa-Pro aminopeptidase